MPADLELLEGRLGYVFADRTLLVRALTHKSSLPAPHNEQLEFLGDSILGFIVSDRLVRLLPDLAEGPLSQRRAYIISAVHLHDVANSLDLGLFLHLGKGEEVGGGRTKRALLANAVEAVIAALYLDGGLEVARGFVDRYVIHPLDIAASPDAQRRDFKSGLQERARQLKLPSPRYVVMDETGPEHARTFVIEVTMGAEWSGRGEGRTKKAASQSAAEQLYRRLP